MLFFKKKNKKQKLNILVVGGTRFFGIPMVNRLLEMGHKVTIATRGQSGDPFGDKVDRIIIDRSNEKTIEAVLDGVIYDVVIDKIAYSSNDVRRLLEHVICKRYIGMSSTAVYPVLHENTFENEFDGSIGNVTWMERSMDYALGKREMERAALKYIGMETILVRFPFVLGENDYTGRLKFYVDHVMNSIPMNIDNLDAKISFIEETEAGEFLAFLIEANVEGAVNGASNGTISIREILDYIETKTGKKPVISKDGDDAPYNGTPGNSISTRKAMEAGFAFTHIDEWIYKLLDKYICDKK